MNSFRVTDLAYFYHLAYFCAWRKTRRLRENDMKNENDETAGTRIAREAREATNDLIDDQLEELRRRGMEQWWGDAMGECVDEIEELAARDQRLRELIKEREKP